MKIKAFIPMILLAVFSSCKKSENVGDAAKSKDAANDIVAYVKAMLSEMLDSTPPRKDPSTTGTEPPEPSPPKKLENASDQETSEFKASYDAWTKRALAEFPELGVANSSMNTLFLARVKLMREHNSHELRYPNWPYVLAVQISQESNKEKAATAKIPPVNPKTGTMAKTLESSPESRKNDTPINQSKSQVQHSVSPKEDWTWTVKELSQLATMPSRATVKGTVTKIQKQIAGDPFDVILTLDNVLACEINVRQAMQAEQAHTHSPSYPYYGVTQSSNLELIYESSSVRLRQRNVSTVTRNLPYYYSDYWYNNRSSVSVNQRDLLVIKLGDNKSIKGILTRKPSGKVVLKGQLE